MYVAVANENARERNVMTLIPVKGRVERAESWLRDRQPCESKVTRLTTTLGTLEFGTVVGLRGSNVREEDQYPCYSKALLWRVYIRAIARRA